VTRPQTTEDLIDSLSRQPAPKPFAPWRAGVAAAAMAMAAVVAFWLVLGLRPDISTALAVPMVLLKSAIPLALACLAFPLALASTRPGGQVPATILLLPVAIALAAFGWRLAALPAPRIWPELLGQTAAACLVSITAMALLPIWLGLRLLRDGAPVHPQRTGALFGLATGATVATGYALHCTEDSPLFFVVWYGLGMALTAGIGAIAGRRLLRW
jgi:hypothetical protein